jgi:hypothetical protein
MNVNLCEPQPFRPEGVLKSPEPVRVRVLNPLIHTSSAMQCLLVEITGNRLRLRSPHLIVVGSAVQVLSGKRIAFGLVCTCLTAGEEFEIGVEMEKVD